MHTCAHTHTLIHPLTHTLGYIPVTWAKVNYASLYVYYISFPIQKTYSFPDNVYFFLGVYVEVFKIPNLKGLLKHKTCLNFHLFCNI